jgi:uncharacterized protein (TIGR02145 family)
MKTYLSIFLILTAVFFFSCQEENPELVNDIFFHTELGKMNTDSVKDFDGNTYHTITIGNQVWMAENLRVTHYADGTPIKESFAPNEVNENIKKYGRLYSFDVAMRGDSIKGSQGICPEGWHLPTRDEWENLMKVVIGRKQELSFAEKLCSATDWIGMKNGSNFSLFNAYPSGNHINNSSIDFGEQSSIWLSDLYLGFYPTYYNLCPDSTKSKSGYFSWDFKTKYNNLSYIALSVRCIKNSVNLKLPTVVIDSISLKTPKPTVYGRVTDKGNGFIGKVGICYGQNNNVNLKDTIVNGEISSNGLFSCTMKVNVPNSTYYVRAFAANDLGSGFSKESICKTTIFVPQLSLVTFSNISATTFTSSAWVDNDGGNAVLAKGVCWSIIANPTTSGNKTSDGVGQAIFESNVSGLIANTSYYVRAYATNAKGTGYNEQVQLITLPNVNVGTPSSLTFKSATLSGIIPNQGNNPIIEYGHCWSTTSNPTISENKIVSSNLIASNFTTAMTGLMGNTKYYVRAFIKNNSGTNYSSEITFTTPPNPYTVSDGLLAFYNFDNKNANDALGSYNGSSVGGLTYTSASPSLSGYAAQFDGTSGYMSIPKQIFPSTGAWTYSVWVKTNKTDNFLLFINKFGKYLYTNSSAQLFAYYSNLYASDNFYSFNLASTLLNGNWHLLTLSYSSGVQILYVDAVRLGSYTNFPGDWGNHDTTLIGKGEGAWTNTFYFSGSMDNVRFYNRALTTTEIMLLFNAKQ